MAKKLIAYLVVSLIFISAFMYFDLSAGYKFASMLLLLAIVFPVVYVRWLKTKIENGTAAARVTPSKVLIGTGSFLIACGILVVPILLRDGPKYLEAILFYLFVLLLGLGIICFGIYRRRLEK